MRGKRKIGNWDVQDFGVGWPTDTGILIFAWIAR
jgi:hypothetical protein